MGDRPGSMEKGLNRVTAACSSQMLYLEESYRQSTILEGELDDNFSYFSSKPYVGTPHLNRLVGTVQMRGHNIC